MPVLACFLSDLPVPLIHNVGAAVPEDTFPRLPGQLASGQIQVREVLEGDWQVDGKENPEYSPCLSIGFMPWLHLLHPSGARCGLPFPGWHLLAHSFDQGSIPTRWPWPWALGTPSPALASQPQPLLTSVLLHHPCSACWQS